jgi:hypothetical protein
MQMNTSPQGHRPPFAATAQVFTADRANQTYMHKFIMGDFSTNGKNILKSFL